ncbi:hypothetical protein A2U01_0076234, partial [Trifolium medium]|nr:hypothetical protein [Trifolium medium]
HRAGRFGGLQFAQICVECVIAVKAFFSPERVWSGKGPISG